MAPYAKLLVWTSSTNGQTARTSLVAHNLPTLRGVDSVPQWKFILNGTNARTKPLHLSSQAVLEFPFKLIIGEQIYATWQAPLYPNCSGIEQFDEIGPFIKDTNIFGVETSLSPFKYKVDAFTQMHDCKAGCLFNVLTDPEEHIDLAVNPDRQMAQKLQELQSLLNDLNENNFEPERGNQSFQACEQYIDNGGYFGPFVGTKDFYTPVNFTEGQKNENDKLRQELKILNEAIDATSVIQQRALKILPLHFIVDTPKNTDVCRVPSMDYIYDYNDDYYYYYDYDYYDYDSHVSLLI